MLLFSFRKECSTVRSRTSRKCIWFFEKRWMLHSISGASDDCARRFCCRTCPAVWVVGCSSPQKGSSALHRLCVSIFQGAVHRWHYVRIDLWESTMSVLAKKTLMSCWLRTSCTLATCKAERQKGEVRLPWDRVGPLHCRSSEDRAFVMTWALNRQRISRFLRA